MPLSLVFAFLGFLKWASCHSVAWGGGFYLRGFLPVCLFRLSSPDSSPADTHVLPLSSRWRNNQQATGSGRGVSFTRRQICQLFSAIDFIHL